MVSGSLSSDGGSGEDATPLKTYREKFDELFPYYLSIGMTEEQYWDKDCLLVIAYRKADELRKDRMNSELWLQGMYFYDALSRVAPIMHAFAKKGTKAQPYVEQPYALSNKQVENEQEKKEKAAYNKGKMAMERFMVDTNQKINAMKGSEEHGDDNRTVRT